MKEEDIRKREVFNKYIELSAKDINVYFNDRSKFIQTDCPACGSNKIKESIDKESFTYEVCNDCDTIYVNPRPDIESLNRYYTDSPSTKYWVNEFFLPVAKARQEKIFKPRAKFVANYFAEHENLQIADIGAGFGLFLEELKKIKPDYGLTAIEPSNDMVEICRNKKLNVIPLLLEEINPEKYKFDVLTSFELFEHLQDPKYFLEQVLKLLPEGGYFVFTTLNGLGFDIQVLWDKAKSISPPHHLNFFNPWSIEKLMISLGFEIVEIETPGKLDWDIVNGMFENENQKIGRFWEAFSKYGTSESKKELQNWLSKHLFSSHMRVIARKPISL
jgi:2-polyprenyl-3-methyl-5-hydroxy-6-metoxy-1,4-benzoquinol methylase